jgi:hypothetical protein
MNWTKVDDSDTHRPTDVRYKRNIIGFWLFGWGEAVRVVEYKDATDDPYNGLVAIYTRFFWIRDSFHNTVLGWEVNKIFSRIWHIYKTGEIEEFVDKYPFIGQYSPRMVRQNKLDDLLTKHTSK